MEALILSLGYALSGFLMKFSDDSYDEKQDKSLAIFLGIICGVLIGYLTVNNIDAAYIFFSIFLGTLFARKIDGIHHVVTLIAFLGIVFVLGIPYITISGIVTLFILSLAAFADEIGNDNEKIAEKSKFWDIFFKYRFTMKIIILILSLMGLWQIISGNIINGIAVLSPVTIIYFVLFEISYELAGHLFDGLYNRFCSLRRVF